MRGERLRKAEAVFHALVDLTPTQRAAEVSARCGDDEELRAFVEKLLASHESGAVDLLRTPVYGPPTTAPDEIRFATPERVGRYRIIDLIGEGGMGVVYRAEQTEPLRRQVALKLIKLGMDTRQVTARFESERQALALMDHPNIAHVFDAGVAEDGRPFFVMEYVPGVVITDYCDTHRLATRQRLDLFLQVCEAVQHAHQKGVIHRDLKPGNILVDEQGRPRILDFGVARLTNSAVQTLTMHTAVGQLVGTVPFMSPEQVTGVSANVDTRSDVYALGVICFKLLTGRLPHDLQDRSIPDAVRIIREEAPTRLSSIDTIFRGDLDTIILKALEKDKDRRYQSASEFAADIRNFLDARPIAARPPTTLYQLRMFTRRNKALVGGVLATFLALLIGITGIAIQATRVTRERNSAQIAEQLADQRRADAERRAYAANIAAAQAAIQTHDVAIGRQRLEAAAPHLRDWEWRYLSTGLDASLVCLRGHEKAAWGAAFAPDGTWLASCSSDGTAKVWDARSGELLRTIHEGDAMLESLAVGPAGDRIITTAMQYGRIDIWDADSCEKLTSLHGHSDSLKAVAVSPDGRLIASASVDRSARVWDADTGEMLLVLEHPTRVTAVCFSPDVTRLATSCRDNVARVWDLATGEPLLKIAVLPQTTEWDFIHSWAVEFSPDGKILATGGHDGVIGLWDATTGVLIKTLAGHGHRVRSLAFSPDGLRLASASDDRTVRIWDPGSGAELATLRGHEDSVFCVEFSPDGRRLASASGDRTVRIWDARTTSRTSRMWGHGNLGFRDMAVSPDGARILSGGEDDLVKLWDARSGLCLQEMRGHESYVGSVALSPDATHALSGSGDETLRLWDLETGEEVAQLTGHNGYVSGVAFIADGTRAASAGIDGTIRLWDLATRSEMATMAGDSPQFSALASSPDGQQLASGANTGRIEFWDIRTGRRVNVAEGHQHRIRKLAYSPDGALLASASVDQTLKVWNARTAALITTLHGHTHEVSGVAFNPEGTRIASVSFDRTLRLWDPATGESVLSFRAHRDWPFSVVFSPDGTWLASGGKSVRLWEATTPSPQIMEQRFARVAAEDLVDRLFADAEDDAEVRALIESDETIGDEVRRYALQATQFRADDRETEDD